MRQRFILDTTAVTDTGLRDKEGYESVCESAMDIMDLIARARLKLEISCYVPFPTVYGELTSFLRKSNCEDDVFLKLDTWVVKKTPNRYEVKIPAAIFHDYVLTVRQKINRGRRVAEEFIWESSAATAKLDGKEAVQKEVGDLVGKFRDKYRTALRQGILDSSPDLDVLLLAKELEAGVVSSDAGIRKWSERMGLRFVDASKFPRMLKEYLQLVESKEGAGFKVLEKEEAE